MRTKFLFLSICFLLGGCLLGPDFEPPEVTPKDVYRSPVAKGQQLTNLKWWEVYQDKVLHDLIDVALLNNQDLKIALARIEEAEAILGIARADFYPELNLSGTLGRNEFENPARDFEEREGYSVATPLFWELDIFGRFRRSTEAAKAEMLSQEYFYRATTLTLVASVANTYFQLLDFDNQLEISKRTLASRKKSTGIIDARFQKGYVAQIDYFQAKIQEEEAASALESRRRAVRQTENALSVLLGGMPRKIARGPKLHDQPELPAIPAGLPSDLLMRRPDIEASLQSLRAQNARIGVAEALRFPRLSLTGNFGVDSLEFDDFNWSQDRFWSFSTDVIGPILSANRNINRVEAEEARTRQATESYYQTVYQAFQEVEDALIAVDTFRDEHAARDRQVKAGRSASRLSQARYDGGETSYLEVLNTEQLLFDAELAESDALRRKFTAIVDLYRALGGGWEIEDQNTQNQNPSAPQTTNP